MTPVDGLIRCSRGCGRVLSFERLTTGLRDPGGGMACIPCVGEQILRDAANAHGLCGPQTESLVEKFASWVEADQTDFTATAPRSPS